MHLQTLRHLLSGTRMGVKSQHPRKFYYCCVQPSRMHTFVSTHCMPSSITRNEWTIGPYSINTGWVNGMCLISHLLDEGGNVLYDEMKSNFQDLKWLEFCGIVSAMKGVISKLQSEPIHLFAWLESRNFILVTTSFYKFHKNACIWKICS